MRRAICRAAPEGAVDADVAADVAALARRVEARLGTPQDVEWALAGDALVLLQARPITALPDQAVGAGAGAGRGAARVLGAGGQPRAQAVDADDPLGLGQARSRAMRRMFAEFGLLAETLELAQIGGWEYADWCRSAARTGRRRRPG